METEAEETEGEETVDEETVEDDVGIAAEAGAEEAMGETEAALAGTPTAIARLSAVIRLPEPVTIRFILHTTVTTLSPRRRATPSYLQPPPTHSNLNLMWSIHTKQT